MKNRLILLKQSPTVISILLIMCCGQICGMRSSLSLSLTLSRSSQCIPDVVVEPLATNCVWRIYQRKTSRERRIKKTVWTLTKTEWKMEQTTTVNSNDSRWFFIPHKFIFDFCLTWLLITHNQAHTRMHTASIKQQLNFYFSYFSFISLVAFHS